MADSLLIELLCEELPPKALKRLGEAFSHNVFNGLTRYKLIGSVGEPTIFATPRRLAVRVPAVLSVGTATTRREKVLPVSIAFDAAGKPTAPLFKKLGALGLSEAVIPQLKRESDGKSEALFYEDTNVQGAVLDGVLGEIVRDALAKLPIPKVMSYQLPDLTTVQFVRPAHRLIALHGDRVVPIEVLGLHARRTTLGHRFMSTGELSIAHADAYEKTLAHDGKVIASFDARRALIVRELEAKARGSILVHNDALLDEVTALVEWPVAYEAHFDAEFLEVPAECLVLTMQLNQKYFALQDANGALLNRFLLISNLAASDPSRIVGGNERVLRARLADAKFFYDTDRKRPLISQLDGLKTVTHHNKLGSVFDRVERIAQIAGYIAERLNQSARLNEVTRAAQLLKCDLLTGMVGEFPELQGVMGAYYARHDGETESVARAIGTQYKPRVDDETMAHDPVVASTYLAERAEALVGIWGIGLAPTGEKDPYALRRAALGLIDMIEALGPQAARLELRGLLEAALATFKGQSLSPTVIEETIAFIYDRARNQLSVKHDRDAVDAVIALRPPLQELALRIEAVVRFRALPEAASLAAANKRIGNILKKSEGAHQSLNTALFSEPAERGLAVELDAVRADANAHFDHGDYAQSLASLAALRDPVDAFFDGVMVMADDPGVRANRIALLRELHVAMNRVADLSRLAA